VADETTVSGREFQTLITLTRFEKKWPSQTEAEWVYIVLHSSPRMVTSTTSKNESTSTQRPRGRPRRTWLCTVQLDLQPHNLGLNSAWKRAQDRSKWRQLVETAMLTEGRATWRWWRRCCQGPIRSEYKDLRLENKDKDLWPKDKELKPADTDRICKLVLEDPQRQGLSSKTTILMSSK